MFTEETASSNVPLSLCYWHSDQKRSLENARQLLCGRVSFEFDLPFQTFVNCHCSRCRKATGTAHAVNGTVAPDALRWLSGEESITRYDLPTAKSFATSFCKECGSPVPHLTRGGSRWI